MHDATLARLKKMATAVSVFLFVCAVLYQFCTMCAAPSVQRPTSNNDGRATDARGQAISAVVRQTACSNSSQCLPEEFRNDSVPPDIVNCTNGVCSCSSCFTVIGGTCAVTQCWSFENGSCVDGRTRPQETATLLSAFLSSVGAANFYIGRTSLGTVQLVMFIFLISVVSCTIGCCCCLCPNYILEYDKDPTEGPSFSEIMDYYVSSCCICMCVFIVAITILGVFAWWLADLVMFTTGQKLDGNGCPLS